jgi:leucyl/phenylalanyl-tRNA--protein transferase
MIDCQQNTGHLASLGAAEMARADFVTHVAQASQLPPLRWAYFYDDWKCLFSQSM